MSLNIGHIAEHAVFNFLKIAAVIRTEASTAIDAIHLAIDNGTDEKIILDEWNSALSENNYYETLDELLVWLRTVGI